jgi:hypothetical protein
MKKKIGRRQNERSSKQRPRKQRSQRSGSQASQRNATQKLKKPSRKGKPRLLVKYWVPMTIPKQPRQKKQNQRPKGR